MLHGAGNWPLLSPAQLHQLTATYMKWVRSITGDGFWAVDQSTDLHLQFGLGCPSIPLRLAKLRLLFAFHFFRDAPVAIVDFVTCVASSPGSWFHALRHSTHWVVSMDLQLSRMTLLWPPLNACVDGFMNMLATVLALFADFINELFTRGVSSEQHGPLIMTFKRP